MDNPLDTTLRPAFRPQAAPQPLALARLYPPSADAVFLDGPAARIGRDADNEIVADDASVSRIHAVLTREDGQLVIQDLGSKNGTFVNRGRISSTRPLRVGDVVRTGDVLFCVAPHLPAEDRDSDSPSPIIGGAPLAEVRRQLALFGPTALRVMILGESGTGKELVARELHLQSRCNGPFVAINCAALPESLIESELFGHVRGAFTGATSERAGLFEAATDGTLFLDEVAELPLASQAKLLRVVESGELRRVGSHKTLKTRCRIISATNHDVRQDVDEGRFRGDLRARLAETEIQLPPLRERRQDIPLLIDHLAKRGRCSARLTAETIEVLVCYPWPLNVRELDNVVRMLDALARGGVVTPADLPPYLFAGSANQGAREPKHDRVIRALRENDGNIRLTSRLLGVSRSYIYRCLDRSGLTPKDLRTA
ncbi:MAG: sigma 54-interacting transcriptional regulator [Deltaproteobacteria bacterium]|nr:sigma 54-interacting transcriptional regulator [Deltaproteobacteria bacterium]